MVDRGDTLDLVAGEGHSAATRARFTVWHTTPCSRCRGHSSECLCSGNDKVPMQSPIAYEEPNETFQGNIGKGNAPGCPRCEDIHQARERATDTFQQWMAAASPAEHICRCGAMPTSRASAPSSNVSLALPALDSDEPAYDLPQNAHV